MVCPGCAAENKAGRKFCRACGRQLDALSCPACAFVNDPGDRYCGGCNRLLLEARPGALERVGGEVHEHARAAADAERRRLTVMFADLVGSTQLSSRLDPEELRELIAAYQALATRAVGRHDGYVAQFQGDGVMAYFGYPHAHEDDPQRALRAALELTSEMPEMSARLAREFPLLREIPLQARVGVHTGLVVIGEMRGGSYRFESAVIGETPNLAARLQSLATPNAVVVSGAVHDLVRGYFEFESLGAQALKGISEPTSVYRVVAAGDARTRFDVASKGSLTPLVGRKEEVGRLRALWDLARHGRGQCALVIGEAGIGKSRLVWELRQEAGRQDATRIEYRCSPYHQNTAYHPILEHVVRVLGLASASTPSDKIARIEAGLRDAGFALEENVPLLAALFSLPPPAGYAPLTLAPQRQRERTHELLIGWILHESTKKPVLAVWEDLHWADPSTLELYHLLGDRLAESSILVLATTRPEGGLDRSRRFSATELALGRLAHGEVERMAVQVAGGKALPTEMMREIVTKTDGVPLFVEELVKMVVESGIIAPREGAYELASPAASLAIPSTLQDSLMARLDRLSAVREVVQLGALLGREFSYDLIRAVWPQSDESLKSGLAVLVEADLLHEASTGRYAFKHALIQETAYGSLLKSRRQQFHGTVARMLELKFAASAEAEPEVLARHYAAANLKPDAIRCWQKAGENAAKRSANKEAVSHLSTALELLRTLPESPERAQQELAIQVTLSAPLAAIKGYAAAEVERTFTRARELCNEMGETPRLFPILFRLRAYYVVHGELRTALEIGEQLVRLATAAGDDDLLVEAHYSLGTVLIHLGRFREACDAFARALALYDFDKHRTHALLFGQDPAVASLVYESWARAYLGERERALACFDQAMAIAVRLEHPLTESFCWTIGATVAQVMGDAQATL